MKGSETLKRMARTSTTREMMYDTFTDLRRTFFATVAIMTMTMATTATVIATPMVELQSQTAQIRVMLQYSSSSTRRPVQSLEPQCNFTLNNSEPSRSAAEARRG